MSEQIIITMSEQPRVSFEVSKDTAAKYQKTFPNRSRQKIMRAVLKETFNLIDKIGVDQFIDALNKGKVKLDIVN